MPSTFATRTLIVLIKATSQRMNAATDHVPLVGLGAETFLTNASRTRKFVVKLLFFFYLNIF